MTQEEINYLHNTKEVLVSPAWDNIVSDHLSAMAKNGESLGIFLCLSLFYYYHVFLTFQTKHILAQVK